MKRSCSPPFTYIGDLAETEARMEELFRKLESPVLTDLAVDWPAAAGGQVEMHPSPLPDLYAGETITFTARLPAAAMSELDGALLVTGRTGAEAWQRHVSLANLEPAPGVAALWARARIAGIRDGLHLGRDPEAVRREATEVALKHRLVSVYTSLVAVDDVISRPEGAPLVRSEVPRELPEGWSYEHVFGEAEKVMRLRAVPASMKQALATTNDASGQSVGLPQTATPATQQAVIGLGLAALGAYLLLFAGRLRRARTGVHG
jgi:Ca-activated chloride channel family protein